MKVIFYRERCIGCGACVQAYPRRWQISRADGKSNLIGSTIKRDTYILPSTQVETEEFRESAQVCPVKIIQVIG